MANESLMKIVNNAAPLYADKMGLYKKWIMEGEKWNEKRAWKEARALAAHFGEAIETMPREDLRKLRYGAKDFAEAADEMIEEFKDEERPMWSDKPRLGAVEGWVVTHDGETIKSGFKDDFSAVNWLHRRQGQSADWAIRYSGYDIVHVRHGKVVYSYKQNLKRLKQ